MATLPTFGDHLCNVCLVVNGMPAHLPVSLNLYLEKAEIETVIHCDSLFPRIKVFSCVLCSVIPLGMKGSKAHILDITLFYCAGD